MISQAFYDSILGWDWERLQFLLHFTVALIVVGVTLKAMGIDGLHLAVVLLYLGIGAPGFRELILR